MYIHAPSLIVLGVRGCIEKIQVPTVNKYKLWLEFMKSDTPQIASWSCKDELGPQYKPNNLVEGCALEM